MTVIGLPLWFTSTALACAIHFIAYALIIRKLRFFTTEKGIVLYHALAGLALIGPKLSGTSLLSSPTLASAAGTASLFAVYSLTFLGLWASSDGGFSLRILDHIDRAEEDVAPDLSDLTRLGDEKKKDRLGGLQGGSLIASTDGRFSLTWRGVLAAYFLGALAWLCGSGPEEETP